MQPRAPIRPNQRYANSSPNQQYYTPNCPITASDPHRSGTPHLVTTEQNRMPPCQRHGADNGTRSSVTHQYEMMSVSDIPHKIFDTVVDAICEQLDREERAFSEENPSGLSHDQRRVHRFLNNPNSRCLIGDEIGCRFRNHLNHLRQPRRRHPRRNRGPNHPTIRNLSPSYYCRSSGHGCQTAARPRNSDPKAQFQYNSSGSF